MCNKQGIQSGKENSKENHIRGLSSSVQYSIECCQKDFCNIGPYPTLQDYSTSKMFIS
jgi:hypothetical protein